MTIATLAAAFVTAFLASYHCVGMCGPLVILADSASPRFRFKIGLYHAGRLFTYAFLGALAGSLGSGFGQIATTLKLAPSAISIVFGVLMIVFGVRWILRRGIVAGDSSSPAMSGVCGAIQALRDTPSKVTAFGIGVANGFLPCPLVYAFLMNAASTASAAGGMTIMAAMGMGTLPAMSAVAALSRRSPSWITRHATVLAGALMVYLGIISILRATGGCPGHPGLM